MGPVKSVECLNGEFMSEIFNLLLLLYQFCGAGAATFRAGAAQKSGGSATLLYPIPIYICGSVPVLGIRIRIHKATEYGSNPLRIRIHNTAKNV